jgi:hypothetical protein
MFRLRLTQACQQGTHMRQVNFAFGLGTTEQQIHQRVIRQVQQTGQRIDFFVRHDFLVLVEEAGQDQVVLEQSAAAAPAQARTVGGVRLMRCHT